MKLKFNHIIIAVLSLSLSLSLQAQGPPGPTQSLSTAIVNATIHIGNGKTIKSGHILFDKGRIQYVGTDKSKIGEAQRVIDAEGKHVYPGFICMNTKLGLAEIEQVKATHDHSELGKYNPNVRSLSSYNTDSKIIPTVRSNGMLYAQVAPESGLISGQSSVVQLDAWNWEDAVIKADEGIFLNWPSPLSNFRRAEPGEKAEDRYKKETDQLYDYFNQARSYSLNQNISETNQAFESLKGLWNGSKKIYIRANRAKAMIHALQFADSFKLKLVLVGAEDAWRIIDHLKDHQVAIILSQTHSLPARVDDDIDQSFKTPAILQQNGILYCLHIRGFWEQRNLMFQAGHATGFGLDPEDAVSAISLNAAKIMGLDHKIGSLEEGKDASLFISKGDALDMRTNEVIHAFIEGREIDLDNKQKQLYKKYQEKYKRLESK